jgi:hypothetical protein
MLLFVLRHIYICAIAARCRMFVKNEDEKEAGYCIDGSEASYILHQTGQ